MSGLGVLLRGFLRRDRWTIVWFTLGITLLYWSQGYSVDGLYATQKAFDEAAAAMSANTGFIAMAGPARALNTTGGQVAWQSTAFGAILIGLMSMFLVGRHTRAEEESGREELLRAGVVGRRAPMTAALLVVVIASAVVGLGVTVSLLGYGLAGAGSVALGVGLFGCGLVFGAFALVAVQLTSSTRAAYGMTGAVIGLSYALRAIGDVSGGPWSWLTPIGWYQSMRSFADERWWPLLLLLGLAGVVALTAYAVFDRRDIGAGVLAARPGPDRASGSLGSGLGLAWRLQRPSLLGWLGGMSLAGLAYGSFGDDVTSIIGDSAAAKSMFGLGGEVLLDAFYASSAAMLAVMASGFTVSSALRPRAEEDQDRLEALVATALPRRRWLLGHVAITVLGTVCVLAGTGLGLALGYGLVTDDWERSGRLVFACVLLTPAVLVLGAVARLLHGWVPRMASLAWLGVLFCAVVMFFGALLDFPQWILDLSPFTHSGSYPAEPVDWVGVVTVLLVAGAISAAGVWGFARRDLD